MPSKSNKKEIKNIIIVNDYDYVQGGASKVAIQTANMIANSNFDGNVYFLSAVHKNEKCLDDKVIQICTNQGEALHSKNIFKGFFNGIYNLKAKKTLKKLIANMSNTNTIIHIHGWTKALSSSVFHIAFKKKFKVVLTMHDYFTACPNGGYFNYKVNKICKLKPMSWKCIKCNCDSRNYLFKFYRIIRQYVQNNIVKLNKNLTNVIAISDFSEKILTPTLNNNIKIHKILNPIDLDAMPEKIDYKKNNYYLYVGRVTKEKGVDLFCKAMEELSMKGIVVGDGSELNKLKEIYPNIEYVGWKDNITVKKYMRGAKALIVPSKWYEGAPLTPLEAMQYGIPVITSACNATVDYIEEGENGFIFNDYEELKKKILKNECEKMKCDFHYKNNYIVDIMKCYDNIIKNKNGE